MRGRYRAARGRGRSDARSRPTIELRLDLGLRGLHLVESVGDLGQPSGGLTRAAQDRARRVRVGVASVWRGGEAKGSGRT
jgi:hypothetical protein